MNLPDFALPFWHRTRYGFGIRLSAFLQNNAPTGGDFSKWQSATKDWMKSNGWVYSQRAHAWFPASGPVTIEEGLK